MNSCQLYDIIEELFEDLELPYSDKVVDMLIETACVESNCGTYLKQINGPACGIFQIEPKTAQDVYDNYIIFRQHYVDIYNKLFIKSLSLKQNLIYNLAFQIFICRLIYLRIKEAIPDNTKDRANYWKKYYNTKLGKGTTQDYISKVRKYYDRKHI